MPNHTYDCNSIFPEISYRVSQKKVSVFDYIYQKN